MNAMSGVPLTRSLCAAVAVPQRRPDGVWLCRPPQQGGRRVARSTALCVITCRWKWTCAFVDKHVGHAASHPRRGHGGKDAAPGASHGRWRPEAVRNLALQAFLVSLAYRCMQLANFEATFAIAGGLKSEAIVRLKAVWRGLAKVRLSQRCAPPELTTGTRVAITGPSRLVGRGADIGLARALLRSIPVRFGGRPLGPWRTAHAGCSFGAVARSEALKQAMDEGRPVVPFLGAIIGAVRSLETQFPDRRAARARLCATCLICRCSQHVEPGRPRRGYRHRRQPREGECAERRWAAH